MRNISILLRKEWLELRKQPGLMLSLLALPTMFTALAIGMTLILGAFPDQDTLDLPIAQLNPAFASMSTAEIGQAIIGGQMSFLLTLLPIMLPSILASYSIVGEKTSRTLEPLLATPVTTWELLIAKGLAALLPAIALTVLSTSLFTIAIWSGVAPAVRTIIISPAWLTLMFLCTPSVGMITVAGMVAISSRVNDPRTAQQFSAIGIVPVMVLILGQMAGVVQLGALAAIILALVLALIAALSIWGAVKLFARERILTRWK